MRWQQAIITPNYSANKGECRGRRLISAETSRVMKVLARFGGDGCDDAHHSLLIAFEMRSVRLPLQDNIAVWEGTCSSF